MAGSTQGKGHWAVRQRGFTLVESMVSVSVAAILTAAGLPSLSSLMEKQAVLAEVSQFEEAVRRTRTEAIAHGETVTVCALDPASSATAPACRPSGTDWSSGWLVFVDRAERGTLDANDVVLAVHQASARAGAIEATLRYISFQSLGISSSAASHLQFRPKSAKAVDDNPLNSRLVCVSKPGRTRVLQSAVCT